VRGDPAQRLCTLIPGRRSSGNLLPCLRAVTLPCRHHRMAFGPPRPQHRWNTALRGPFPREPARGYCGTPRTPGFSDTSSIHHLLNSSPGCVPTLSIDRHHRRPVVSPGKGPSTCDIVRLLGPAIPKSPSATVASDDSSRADENGEHALCPTPLHSSAPPRPASSSPQHRPAFLRLGLAAHTHGLQPERAPCV